MVLESQKDCMEGVIRFVLNSIGTATGLASLWEVFVMLGDTIGC